MKREGQTVLKQKSNFTTIGENFEIFLEELKGVNVKDKKIEI